MPTRLMVVVSVIAAPSRRGSDEDIYPRVTTVKMRSWTMTSPRRSAFFLEIDKLKSVERRNHLADSSRVENTAEHSWHLGMAVAILAPFATEPVDLARAITMALVHDVVEIDAGDTFAYDEDSSKAAREEAAADRLFGILPPAMGAYLRGLWEE